LCGASLAAPAETAVSVELPYRYLFEHAAEALAIVDAENGITRVNRKFAQLAGLERAAIEGRRRIEEFMVPAEKVRLVTGSGHTQTLLASSLSSFILAFRRSDGSETQVEAAFNLLSDSQYLVSLRDVTAERLTERRLYALWQFSGLVSASLDPQEVVRNIVERVAPLLDVELLTVSLLDDLRKRVLTLAEYEKATRKPILRFDDPVESDLEAVHGLDRVLADIEPVYLEHQDMLRLGKTAAGSTTPGRNPLPAAGLTEAATSDSRPPTADGPAKRGWAIVFPMPARGEVQGVMYVADTRPERVFSGLEIAICSTIAAQAATAIENARLYQAEVRTREEVALLRDYNQSILDNLSSGVFVIDAESRVQFWNRTLEQLLDIPRDSILHQNLFEHVAPLAPHAEKVRQIARTRRPYAVDRLTRQSEHRGEVTESYRFQPLLREDRLAGILCVVEDLTLRVKLDSQLIRSERLAAVGELAAGVAHNFNNILAAIGGDAQLLKLSAEEMELPRSVVDAAEMIYNETMRGGRIAHDLLSFARGQEPQLRSLDLRAVVADTVRLSSNHPAAKAVQIESTLGEHLPRVEADPHQLHQVFFNLILNAVHAMPNGGKLTIAARVRPRDEGADEALLEVKFVDTGCGISPDHLKRIFDPFYSRRPNGGTGTGLGLTLSLSMVRAMGGDIQIASTVGIGTAVMVLLPIVDRRTEARHDSVRRGKILVVDDEPNVRRTLSSFLTRRGYEVHTAGDGEEAVKRVEKALQKQPYELIVMDLMLPKIDGAQAISMITARDPKARVVVVTGTTTPERVLEALERGALFSFTKPLHFPGLGHVVDRLAAAAEG
jgi:PAS domain S-box-containing protein